MADPNPARRARVIVLGLALAATAGAAGAAGRAPAGPATVERVLNPVRDTYLARGESSRNGSATAVRAGFWHLVEHRAYVEFGLDPSLHPPGGLISAELWLRPAQLPNTAVTSSVVRVARLMQTLATDPGYPPWLLAGEPSVVANLDTTTRDWKRFNVTAIVRQILADPANGFGFEVTGPSSQDNTRWDFISLEGGAPVSQDGDQPRLVLRFTDSAFPSPTPTVTDTPTPTASPTATDTPPASATPEPATPSPTPTAPPPALHLPRLLRNL